MSNRSISFLKRFKTERNERANILERRSKTPTTRKISPPYKNLEKVKLLNEEEYILNCWNHPNKKASFEPKFSMSEAFCQECSLRMVKNNMRMISISQESLKLRTLYEAEIEKVTQYQNKALQMVNQYFEAQKEAIKSSFIQAKEKCEKIVQIAVFKIEPITQPIFILKLKEIFGVSSMKTIEFHKEPIAEPVQTTRHRNALSEIYTEAFSESETKENMPNNINKWKRSNKELLRDSIR